MKILALDPAAHCGYAHSNGKYGVWDLGNGPDHGLRLRRKLLKAAEHWGIEQIASEDAGFGANNRATRAMHGERLGIIRLVAVELGVELVLYAPPTVKLHTTGSGRATKEQMIATIRTRFGIRTTNDNEADAIAIMHMAIDGIQPPAKLKRAWKARVKAAEKSQQKFQFAQPARKPRG